MFFNYRDKMGTKGQLKRSGGKTAKGPLLQETIVPEHLAFPTLGKVSQSIPHSPRLGVLFLIFISKAWIASISRSWQNQDTCKIPYNTLDSQKVPKSTVKLTLPLLEMYDTNNIKLKGEKKVTLVS